MNKHIRENKEALEEFLDKVAAKWRLKTQPNTPSKVEEGESAESILRDLVSMPTVTGNTEANHEALEYIDDFLRSRGMHVKRFAWNGVESLVATTRKTKTPTVFLMGHVDVVPASSELFELKERDGYYYGRGVLDMKGGIAGYLAVIEQMGQSIHEYDFGVMIVTDEEVGGFDGAKRLAEEGYLPNVMVVPDGGDNFKLERFAKGIWHPTIEAKGRSAHGSRPWEGENAIDRLLDALREIRSLFPEEMTIETSTINVGVIQGGNAINQIPATASASIDMRFASPEEQQQIISQSLDIFKRYRLEVVTELHADSVTNDPANPYLAAYAACTEEATGKPVEWITSNAGNDSRFFAKYGVPTAIGYPTGDNHHGTEERISVEGYEQFQQIIRSFLERVAKQPTGERSKPAVARK